MQELTLMNNEFEIYGNYAYTGVSSSDEAIDLAFQLLGCEVDFKGPLPAISIDGPFYFSLAQNSNGLILVVSAIKPTETLDVLMLDTFNELHSS